MAENKTDFDSWFRELKRIATEELGFLTADDFDVESWKEYYDDGYSPRAAINVDFSNV